MFMGGGGGGLLKFVFTDNARVNCAAGSTSVLYETWVRISRFFGKLTEKAH